MVALDIVVNVIWRRCDRLQNPRFEFIPPSFYVELLRNYTRFYSMADKGEFAFYSVLKSEFTHRPQWFTQVDYVYSSVLIKKKHWVGLVLHLKMWAIYIVDANPACPSELDVNSYVNPISHMLPYLMAKYCITTVPREMNFDPLTISRLKLPLLLEHPGFSGVASLLLLEMSAAGEPLNAISFSEAEVRVTAENYAIVAMSTLLHYS
ncbi:hypothetical protein N665_0191s0003 [Sinapis alba]|nr:hypothetical protein N665_0191s0003 [Sinapis alba]